MCVINLEKEIRVCQFTYFFGFSCLGSPHKILEMFDSLVEQLGQHFALSIQHFEYTRNTSKQPVSSLYESYGHYVELAGRYAMVALC